jgi:hypothetical protein
MIIRASMPLSAARILAASAKRAGEASPITSTGLARDQFGGSNASSAARVCSPRVARVPSSEASASAASTARPPPLVSIARRSPRSRRTRLSVSAALKSSCQRVHAHHAGAAEYRVVDLVASHHRAGVRGRGARAGGEAPALHHDHGLGARGRARGGNELARARDPLDVEQDGVGAAVVGEVIEHVADVHVAHVAERDDVREADVA